MLLCDAFAARCLNACLEDHVEKESASAVQCFVDDCTLFA
jgi:hypothetical protein